MPETPEHVAPRVRTSKSYDLSDDDVWTLKALLRQDIRKQHRGIDKLRRKLGAGFDSERAHLRLDRLMSVYLRLGGTHGDLIVIEDRA